MAGFDPNDLDVPIDGVEDSNSIPKGTRCHSKQEFAGILRKWHENTKEPIIGGSSTRGQNAWLWVQLRDYQCHLNADTKRQGVGDYLRLVNRFGDDLAWPVRANQNGTKINKVRFGPTAAIIPGFYLYVKPELLSEATIGETVEASEPSPVISEDDLPEMFPQQARFSAGNALEIVSSAAAQSSEYFAKGQIQWTDLSSLKLNGNEWHMKPIELSSEVKQELKSIQMIDTGSCRHAIHIELGCTSRLCRVAITQRRENDGIGCRVVATALERLTRHYGSVGRIPERVYIQARPGSKFRPGRSLLMLQAFADPAIRRDILTQYSWSHVPSQLGEGWRPYEVRAVNILRNTYEGCESVDSSSLFLPGVQSRLDGLFTRPHMKELVIVEAKQRRPDFEEGTSQIMLYYAQAKCSSRFKDWGLHLHLVTSEQEPTGGHQIWQEWMLSDKKLTVFVADNKL